MNLQVEKQTESATVVKLDGRLDLLAAMDVKQRLSDSVKDGSRHLVVDLGEVSFLDSSGLGALISGLKAARLAGGDLRIACAGAQPRLVLELTTLDRVLHPYPTVEQAMVGF